VKLRVNWRLKAVLPIAAVLVNGLLVFQLLSLTLQAPQKLQVRVVAAAGAVVIFAAILGVMSLLLQHPLRELQEKIARVKRGDLSAEVDFAERQDDIGDLGRDFNAMVGQLRESREEIQRLYRTQMSRAEHLATLGEMATGLAHEIRNPLAGIAGVMNIIARDLPQSSPAREVLSEVQQEILQIKRILSDLLETARPKPPDFRSANLNGTVEHAVALARQQTLSRPIQISLKKMHALPPVEHDAGQIQQVLLNLLLNAIQAMEKGGSIRVQVGSADDCATVTIQDSGCGIAPEHLANIFRPFFTTKRRGTGLGLSLVSRIVEEHGGRVQVSSTPGEGTEFVVSLPFHHEGEQAESREEAVATRAS
jgi:signal transduction histidine kinase